jgi:protease-4
MKQFFKFTFASLLGSIVGGIILFFLILMVFMGSLSQSLTMADAKQVNPVLDNSVLHVQFNNSIVDRAPASNFDIAKILQNQGSSEGLNDILRNIWHAKQDPRIKGIFLDISSIPAGAASLEEIRDQLLDFKESGKWIMAYSEIYTQGAYYIASTADEIFLYPQGAMELKGLGGELYFLKDFFDKTGVEMQVIRGSNNRFKSAVEPYLSNHMSDANREQVMGYLGALWGQMLIGISAERGMSVAELTEMADSLYIRTPQDALDYKLIDGLMHRDQIIANLEEKLGLEEGGKINYMTMSKYTKALPWEADNGEFYDMNNYRRKKIAIVYAVGGIEGGTGDDETIGSERISKAIREARLDTSVMAIVLRVNSPGGSALASDVIWRETVLAQQTKPFIVSMGDVAASGGYYIACAADHIFAQPNTITGSIGVFGVLPNIGDALHDHLGINFERVETNQYATMGSTYRALNDDEYSIIQGGVDDVYMTFKARVAEGRGMTVDEVDSVGQGRVWAGTDALRIGLVDELGSLEDACNKAAEMAELEEYRVVSFPEQTSKLEQIMKEMAGDQESKIVNETLGEYAWLYDELKGMQKMKGIQMRMPFILKID